MRPDFSETLPSRVRRVAECEHEFPRPSTTLRWQSREAQVHPESGGYWSDYHKPAQTRPHRNTNRLRPSHCIAADTTPQERRTGALDDDRAVGHGPARHAHGREPAAEGPPREGVERSAEKLAPLVQQGAFAKASPASGQWSPAAPRPTTPPSRARERAHRGAREHAGARDPATPKRSASDAVPVLTTPPGQCVAEAVSAPCRGTP